MYFRNRLERFIQRFENPSNLEKHFHIENYEISTYIPNDDLGLINLNIKYYRKQDIVYFDALPNEISHYIHKFVEPYFVQINIDIHLDNNYPFEPPLFEYKNCINIDESITSFFKFKVKVYNELIKKEWCPAISIDKNILDFFTTINFLKEVFDST